MSYRTGFFIVFFTFGALEWGFSLSHRVVSSDTLFGLSRRYGVPVSWIIRVNGLADERIRIGDVLDIPTEGIDELVVRPGETLSGIAAELGVSRAELKLHNDLESESLRIGQVLMVPAPVPSGSHRVRPGDTVLALALRYDVSAEKLRAYNGLENDLIRAGEILTVLPPRPEGYRVKEGDSIWGIARRFDISPDDLTAWNARARERGIHPGDVLSLFPGLVSPELEDARDARDAPGDSGGIREARPRPALAAVSGAPRGGPPERGAAAPPAGPPREGEYFYGAPRVNKQPDVSYWEGSTASSSVDYRRAMRVLEEFLEGVEGEVPLGRSLEGLHVVIDPGHGGLDPGAVVSVRDGSGNALVITEDEYAYDIALRLYRFLIRHGASAGLTVLAPDHHIREGEDARRTFVNRKSEVYADEAHNEGAGWRPVGTARGLDMRKDAALGSIRNTPGGKKRHGTLFVSIHADNSPDLPAGRAVIFDGADDAEAERSRVLAEALVPYLGRDAFVRRQTLRVLRNNPADAAVLIEVRNVHYERNAWALRSPELREQDARMIGEGILAWAAR